MFGKRPDQKENMTQNPKKFFTLFILKSASTFLLFTLNQSFFIIIQIKKITIKQNVLLFYTKYSYFFFLSHQLNILQYRFTS
jgi:hypothetical protein